MGKRSSRRVAAATAANVHSLFDGQRASWDPLDDRPSDKGYLRKVRPHNENQRVLLDALDSYSVVFAIGPAGTGKTYLAITKAVEALEAGRVSRIILTRPAIEAGENLGFLPGDIEAKLAPYLRPLYDALADRLGVRSLRQLMADGTIEIAPLAYMRGCTINNAYVIVDESQNLTRAQFKMVLTRLGWNSTMALTGDPDQSDLLEGMSGLTEIADRLDRVEGIKVVRLQEGDIVRHPLVAAMLAAI